MVYTIMEQTYSFFTFTTNALSNFVLIYVDDIIITENDKKKLFLHLTKIFEARFSIKQLGKLQYFVGIEVSHFLQVYFFVKENI